MEQGIANDITKSRRTAAAASVLKTLKTELEQLLKDHALVASEKDAAVKRADEAEIASKEIEKTVEELTMELITRKEVLESLRAALVEAEERRIMAATAREQDNANWNNQLKQIMLTRDLKAELASHRDYENEAHLARKELEEVKLNTEKAIAEVTYLKVAAISLKSELEKEKSALDQITRREELESVAIESLKAELNQIKIDTAIVQMNERESRKKMAELPMQIHEAAKEADNAKALAKTAREELRKVKEEAERAKAGADTIESRLIATQMEIEAAKASENLALAVINALQESESNESNKTRVTLPIKEYYELSKRAHEAEEVANTRLAVVMSQMEVAKDTELKSLNKLKEFVKETVVRKESLEIATRKAEKAMEGQFGVEHELKRWRSEVRSSPEEYVESNNEETDSLPEVEFVMKKKRSLFPRIFMFLAKKKIQGKSM